MPGANGSWTESVLYGFSGGRDGGFVDAGLILDAAGNLYGTAFGGGDSNCGNGFGCGTVFKLSTTGEFTRLHAFTGGAEGDTPLAGLILDAAGNLYGTTAGGEVAGHGVVFKLAPKARGGWIYTVLHRFTGGKDGSNPVTGLILDAAGNLYGTTVAGGAKGLGVVFKLTPSAKGGWNESVPWAFGDHPGASPRAGLIFDAVGNLYGTTQGDPKTTFGSVFEITP
jgi:uncharacterized repeat protein (TIGR03803 family)